MGRVVVHIGTHKTGTTSIQRTLAQHRDALREQGLFYPNYDIVGCEGHYAHIGMANALATDHPKLSRQNAEDFFRKVQELSADHATTLISAEPLYRQLLGEQRSYKISDGLHYWDARNRYIERFRSLIGPAEIAIVLRRQDEFAESMYQEQVKVTRYTRTFKSYLKEFWFHFAYEEQIAAWRRHFETVHVIPFNRIKGANITRNFLAEIGCNLPGLEDAPIQNVSMPHDGVILKRAFNGTPLDRDKLDELSDALLSKAFRLAVPPRRRSFFEDDKQHQAFLSGYEATNAALARANGLAPEALFSTGMPGALHYGDTISPEEHDRLLTVLKRSLPDLKANLTRKTDRPLSRTDVARFRKNRPPSFLRELAANRLDYTAGGPTLVITFENAGLPHRGPADRRPWGHKFLTEDGHSVLGVIAKASDWYRNTELHRALVELRDTGFFSRFPHIVLTGSSMGGFAATAFASLVPGCHVISFNPQSTLRQDLVPWEDGHPNGMRQDWTGAFSDGAAEIGPAAKVYIFYDPFHDHDRRHALRYQGKNVHLLRAPFLGHGLPDAYLEMDLLKAIMRHGIAGSLTDEWYYPAIRQRRTLARYYKGIAQPLAKHGLSAQGQTIMRRAAEQFQDPNFRSHEALFMAAGGKLEAAVQLLEQTARAKRKNRTNSGPLTKLAPPPAPVLDFQPNFSVIVPVFQGWGQLPGLLEGLARQTRQDFELIIADNDPQPFAEDKLHRMMPAVLAGRWRRVHCPQPGSYAARNAAGAVARAGLLVFTDADCRPEAGWLSAFAKGERQDRGSLLAGPVRVRARDVPNPWEIFDTVRGIPQERYIAHGYATTANLAVPKSVFDRLGGFDARRLSGGDAEFCRRAKASAISLHLISGAVVTHPARSSRAECETKARRIKGGQLRSGPLGQRLFWALRSLTPPLREMLAYMRDQKHPRRWRLTACAVRLRLWGVELREMGRLVLLRGKPERR